MPSPLPPEEQHHEELVKKQARGFFIQTIVVIIIVCVGFSGIAIAAWAGIEANSTNNTIEDCVEPGGECADRAVEETAKVTKQLIDSDSAKADVIRATIILTEYCSKQVLEEHYNLVSLMKCVEERIVDEEEE